MNVYLITGSTGAGKTTYSRTLAKIKNAQVFSIDEWMKTLFWMDAPSSPDLNWAIDKVGRCEKQIWNVGERLLKSGVPIILDLGFSKKKQRDHFMQLVLKAGFVTELHFLDIPIDIRKSRVQKRNIEKTDTFEFEVSVETFDWMENYFEAPVGEELKSSVVIGN